MKSQIRLEHLIRIRQSLKIKAGLCGIFNCHMVTVDRYLQKNSARLTESDCLKYLASELKVKQKELIEYVAIEKN